MNTNPWVAHLVTGIRGMNTSADDSSANGYDRVPSLSTIYIPRCITFIGYGAFAGCDTVADVYYGGTSEQWSTAVGGRDIGLRVGARVHFQSAEANDLGTCAYYPDFLQKTYYPQKDHDRWYFKLPPEEFRASEVVPSHTLMFGDEALVEGRDYSLACEDNRSCGTARLRALGRGEYGGESLSEFEIVWPTVEHLDANLSVAGASRVVETSTDGLGAIHEFAYWRLPETTIPNAPEISLLYCGNELREGEDYTVELLSSETFGGELWSYYRASLSFYGDVHLSVRCAVRPPASTSVFSDVVGGIAHREDIAWLASEGISEGWAMPDGTRQFRPYASIARADMAAFLFRLARQWGLAEDSWQPSAEQRRAFSDVTERTPHAREIWWLAANGISNGTRVGDVYEFRPYEDVIRRDMAAFLFRLSRLDGRGGAVAGWEPTAAQRSAFADVGPGTIHATSVWWLASTGVSEGWAMPDGTRQFRPASPVARADMAAFLHRLDGLGA
jgi:hypothetical protein